MLGTVHAPLALWMLLGSAPLSLVGVADRELVLRQQHVDDAEVVGGALILGGFGFLAKTFIRGHSDDAPFHLAAPRQG